MTVPGPGWQDVGVERDTIARHLWRAGQWFAALRWLDEANPALRAEIAVDRYWWRLTEADEAEARAAVDALVAENPASTLGALLRGQLAYTRVVFDRSPRADDVERADEDFARAAADPAWRGWASFWRGVVADNLREDPAVAADFYAIAAEHAAVDRDLLLESYLVRHQGAHLLEEDPDQGVLLLRRSLQLRAALGARPQIAAAQVALAMVLPPGDEVDTLREAAAFTATELQLAWLSESLDS